MKKIFWALMVVIAIATAGSIAGCNGPVNEPDDPEAPDNERRDPTTLTGDTYYPTPHPAPVRYIMAK